MECLIDIANVLPPVFTRRMPITSVGLAPSMPILLGPVYKWDPDSVRDLLLIAKDPLGYVLVRDFVAIDHDYATIPCILVSGPLNTDHLVKAVGVDPPPEAKEHTACSDDPL